MTWTAQLPLSCPEAETAESLVDCAWLAVGVKSCEEVLLEETLVDCAWLDSAELSCGIWDYEERLLLLATIWDDGGTLWDVPRTPNGFVQVGNLLSVSCGAPWAVTLNATSLAIIDTASDTLRAFRWDGVDFSLLGETALGAADTYGAAPMQENSVAVFSNATATGSILRKFVFDGSAFAQVGLTTAGLRYGENHRAITGFGQWPYLSDYVVTFTKYAPDNRLRMYQWDEGVTAFVLRGYLTGLPNNGNVRLQNLTNDTLILGNTAVGRCNFSAYQYDFDLDTFVQVAPLLEYPGEVFTSMVRLSESRVAIHLGVSDTIRVLEFDGTSLTEIPIGNTGFNAGNVGMAAFGEEQIAFVDSTTDKLRMLELSYAEDLGSATSWDGTCER
jgi:hypothetical protein